MEKDERLEGIVAHLPRKAGKPARPFWAREEYREGPPDYMGTAIVRIFSDDGEIGQYERNYPSFGERTFEPFELDGRWYALYSRDYTATRIMSLPDCRDLGGEEPASDGFCPVEYFVPRYRPTSTKILRSDRVVETWDFESWGERKPGERSSDTEITRGAWQCLKLGFVADCVWGDDSSWKLEAIDLSMAQQGIIKRDARFGYFEIAASLPLASVVQLSWEAPDRPLKATFLREEKRDLETGKRVDPYTGELLD